MNTSAVISQHLFKLQLFLLTALTLSISAVLASQEVEDINRLISANNPQAAYDLAMVSKSEMEGGPEFDYAFGIAAVLSGHISEGVLALERVVSLEPDNSRARYELAKAYYALGDYIRARRELERLKAGAVTKNDIAAIDSYLSAIRQRETQYETTASAYVQFGFGFDTNVNTGPSDQIVYHSLPLYLSQDATHTSDAYREVAAGGHLDHPLTRRLVLYGELNGRMRQHRHNDIFNNNLYGGQFGVKWVYKNYLVKGSVLAQRYTVDGDISREMAGVTLEALNGITPNSTIGVALNYLDLTFPAQPLRDSRQYTLGSTYTHRWTSKRAPSVYIGIFGGREVADQNSVSAQSVAERELYGLHTGINFRITDKLGITGTIQRQQNDYAAPLFGFLPVRSDTFTARELSLTLLASKSWKLTGTYGISQNSSNIDMYNYTRDQYGVTVRRDF